MLKIYDYDANRQINFTPSMVTLARTTPSKFPGSIEGGRKIARHVLTNRVSDKLHSTSKYSDSEVCKTITRSALRALAPVPRGATKPKKGEALKGSGSNFLGTCGCPIDTALVELFVVKATAGHGPPEPDADNIKTSEFYFNPVNLTMVQSVIELLSGYNSHSLFVLEAVRLQKTVVWALTKLRHDHVNDKKTRKELKDLTRSFEELMSEGAEKSQKGKGKAKNMYVEVDSE